MKKYDIFISHKSQDKNQLTLLEEYLDNEGYSYWCDWKWRKAKARQTKLNVQYLKVE